MQNNEPLVSIPVVTYNSAKTVLETLDSIKAQTYQNIELIISDDCSTDNTIQVCKDWIGSNIDRFVRAIVLESPVNTGISENCSRAEAACEGEWIKCIAGDDLLVPECVECCVNYIIANPSVFYLFGKAQSFGADDSRCMQVDSWFDYSFFNLSRDQQIHRLLFKGNCIPASTAFFNRKETERINVKNDLRIPFLEDWPKWVNLLRAGETFYFIDHVLVKYRIGGISTKARISSKAYRSNRLMLFYYQYPEWVKDDLDKAVKRIVDEECALYDENMDLISSLERIRSSFPYRFYSRILSPIKFFLIRFRKAGNRES